MNRTRKLALDSEHAPLRQGGRQISKCKCSPFVYLIGAYSIQEYAQHSAISPRRYYLEFEDGTWTTHHLQRNTRKSGLAVQR